MVPLVVASVALAAVLAGCGGKQASPPPAPAAAPASTPAPAPVAAGGKAPPGRYLIVADKSKASYQAREKFVNRDLPNEAVGTTSVIKGELVLGEKGLQPSTVTVDLSTLKSDESRRDNYIKTRTLQTDRYPLAEFTISGSNPAPLSFSPGQETRFQVAGTMKIHGVEKPFTWDVTGTRQGTALVWKATAAFKLTDFQLTPPDIASMLKVEDSMKLAVELTAQPAG